MARNQTPSPSTTSDTTYLGLSSFHERHRILEEEHQWLLKQIKRKRSELKNFLDQMRSIATQIFQQAIPVYNQLTALDTETRPSTFWLLVSWFGSSKSECRRA